jgi:hypothetical protein
MTQRAVTKPLAKENRPGPPSPKDIGIPDSTSLQSARQSHKWQEIARADDIYVGKDNAFREPPGEDCSLLHSLFISRVPLRQLHAILAGRALFTRAAMQELTDRQRVPAALWCAFGLCWHGPFACQIRLGNPCNTAQPEEVGLPILPLPCAGGKPTLFH